MKFVLRDVSDSHVGTVIGKVSLERDDSALLVKVEGFGDHGSAHGEGCPILLELRRGTLRLMVWGDINAEWPTHIIDLEDARESARRFSPDGTLTVGQVRKYCESKGVRCPYCGSDDLHCGEWDTQDDAVFRPVACGVCKGKWTDEYSLTGVTEDA